MRIESEGTKNTDRDDRLSVDRRGRDIKQWREPAKMMHATARNRAVVAAAAVAAAAAAAAAAAESLPWSSPQLTLNTCSKVRQSKVRQSKIRQRLSRLVLAAWPVIQRG